MNTCHEAAQSKLAPMSWAAHEVITTWASRSYGAIRSARSPHHVRYTPRGCVLGYAPGPFVVKGASFDVVEMQMGRAGEVLSLVLYALREPKR